MFLMAALQAGFDVVDKPKRTEAERLHDNVSLHLTSTIASLQRDFVDADKLLERQEKSGFDRSAAIELTEKLNGVLLDLRRRGDQCL